MCKPPAKTAAGSRHYLYDRDSPDKLVEFEWTGKSWSTPGTGFGTSPVFMAVLGWGYKRAKEKGE